MPIDLKPPTADIGDFAHATARGILGMVPVVGAPAAELMGFVIGAPLAKRQAEWCESVVAVIEELRGRGVDVEKLRDDPAFTDVVLKATQIAMTTHQTEKLEALRNAIRSSGLSDAPASDERQLYLGLVDRLTVSHLKILVLMDCPQRWFDTHWPPSSPDKPLSAFEMFIVALPGLPLRVSGVMWNDLIRADLLASHTNTGPSQLIIPPSNWNDQFTTFAGRVFLRFIGAAPMPEPEPDSE